MCKVVEIIKPVRTWHIVAEKHYNSLAVAKANAAKWESLAHRLAAVVDGPNISYDAKMDVMDDYRDSYGSMRNEQ